MQDNNFEAGFEKPPETFNPAAGAWENSEMPGDEGFMAENPNPEPYDEYDETISNASQILNYVNKSPSGIQDAIDKISTFDPGAYENPQAELLKILNIAQKEYDSNIEKREELNDIEYQRNRDLQNSEFAYNENNSAKLHEKSRNNFSDAILEIKHLVNTVNAGDEYSELREQARKAGMGPFDYIMKESPIRDLATLFDRIDDFKNKPENVQENAQENIQENAKETPENELKPNF